MYKHSKKISAIVISLLIIYIFLRISGFLQIFTMTTNVLEPNLKLNSTALVSNLISPKYEDFIVFHHTDSIFGNEKYVFRLIGNSMDTIEIRKGVVYRNGKNIDVNLKLAHKYKVSLYEYRKLKKSNKIINSIFKSDLFDKNYLSFNDTITVNLQDEVAKKEGLENRKVIKSKSYVDYDIHKQFNKNWNEDNFGPLVIPVGKYFVLGDNRSIANDSRFIGFIDKSKIIGVVFAN